MSIIEIVLLAIGLSMDSLAVSVTGGAVIRNCTVCNMVKIGSFMGITQATMTVLGYLAGVGFQKYITAFDHWIAFVLLLYLGGKMIYDSTQEEDEDCKTNPLCNKTLFGLSIATSIDALAIGISFAFLGVQNYNEILSPILIIGLVSFVMSLIGLIFGIQCGCGIARKLKAELWGGIILVIIGLKILIEHLFLQ